MGLQKYCQTKRGSRENKVTLLYGNNVMLQEIHTRVA